MRAGPRRRAPALLAVLASLLFLMATSSLNVARAAPPHVPRPRRDLDAGVCAALIGRLDVASGAMLCRASKTFRDVALGSGSSVAALHCPDASTAATISRHDTCSRLLDHIDTLVKVDAHMERTGRTQSREAARTRRSPRDSRRSTSPATSPQRCRNLLADARACLERRHGARNPLTVDLILTAMDALVTTIASFELQLLDVEARFEVEQMVAAAYHEELGPILVDMDANGWDEDEGPQVEVMVAAYDRMFEALLPFTGRGLFYRWERVRNALIKQLRHCSCDENSTDEQDPSCAGFERLLRLQESPHRMHRLLERALRATFGKLSMETRVRRLSMIAPELESWANECEDVYRNVCATYVRWDKNTRSANGVGDYGSDVDFVEDDAMGDADDGWSCPSHLFLCMQWGVLPPSQSISLLTHLLEQPPASSSTASAHQTPVSLVQEHQRQNPHPSSPSAHAVCAAHYWPLPNF